MLTNSTKGFTLIEVLVAITILLTVVFLPLSIIAQYLVNNELTKENIQAQFRAQEIIEFVRYERDTHFIDPTVDTNWFLDLHNKNNIFGNCVIDINDWEKRKKNTVQNTPYCIPACLAGSMIMGSCVDDSSSFVRGIKEGTQTRASNKETCDGNSAKANGEFTITLNIAVSEKNLPIQYAIINPCVSWERANGNISKIELQETVFEWIIRN